MWFVFPFIALALFCWLPVYQYLHVIRDNHSFDIFRLYGVLKKL